MLYLVNPPRKRKKTVAKRRKTKKRRKLTAKQIAAGFGGKRAKAAASKRKRIKRRPTTSRKRKGVSKVAKRRKRSTAKRRTTRRRRRRTSGSIRLTRVKGAIYRKNPPFSIRGITNQLVEGAKGAAGVVVGKAAGRTVANILPIPKDTMIGAVGSQIVSALIVGMVGRRFLPRGIGDYVFVGALTAPVESALKSIPGIGPMLGEDPFLPIGENPFLPMGAYPELGAYPEGAADEEYAALMY